MELLGIQSITSLLEFLGEFGILKYVLKGAGPYIRNTDNVDLFSDLYSIIAKKRKRYNSHIHMKHFAVDTKLELEQVRAAHGKKQIVLEEKDKDFVKKYKRKLEEAVKERQPKRQKLSHTKSKSDEVPQPDLSTQINITSDKGVTVESATRGVSSATTGKGKSGQSSEAFNDQVPESPSPTDRADVIETVPGIGHSAIVTPSTRAGSTLPDFYDSMSPLLSDDEDEFIHQIVNGITRSDSSSSNFPPISNANDYSITEVVSSNFNTAPTFTTLQPVPADILNTLPGGANLRQIGQGLGGLHFTPPQPQMTVNEWQKSVSDTLSTLLFNQEAILNEVKTIKLNLNGITSSEPTVSNQACESGAPLSVMETVTTIPPSSTQQNPALMPIPTSLDLTPDQLGKLKEKELKKNHSPAHLAVAIMNAITTTEQRMGRSVMGTKYRPALGTDILSKIRRYYSSVYPYGENDNEENIWKQCTHCLNNRLKKYDKA